MDGPSCHSRLTEDPVAVGALMEFCAARGHGAQASFVGMVRDHNSGKRVVAVAYDAFKPLAGKVLTAIAEEAHRRWDARVAVCHRLGKLPVGGLSVAVAAGAAHRAEAFDACRYVIEEIKRRLPVYKQEFYEDGSSRWLDGCSLEHGGAGAAREVPMSEQSQQGQGGQGQQGGGNREMQRHHGGHEHRCEHGRDDESERHLDDTVRMWERAFSEAWHEVHVEILKEKIRAKHGADIGAVADDVLRVFGDSWKADMQKLRSSEELKAAVKKGFERGPQ